MAWLRAGSAATRSVDDVDERQRDGVDQPDRVADVVERHPRVVGSTGADNQDDRRQPGPLGDLDDDTADD